MIKKGATKVLAVALSALSVTGGMEINATKIPEKSNKVTTKKSNLKKGILALTPLAVLSLLGIAREMCASETTILKKPPMPVITGEKLDSKKETIELLPVQSKANEVEIDKMRAEDKIRNLYIFWFDECKCIYNYTGDIYHKIGDLFTPGILEPLKGDKFLVDDEKYWNEDITDKFKHMDTNITEYNKCCEDKYYKDKYDKLKFIREIFGTNFFIDLDDAFFNHIEYLLLGFSYGDCIVPRIDNFSFREFASRLFLKDEKLTVTRKTLLKFIVFLAIYAQPREVLDFKNMHCGKLKNGFFPSFPLEIMDLISLPNCTSSLPSLKRMYIHRNFEKCADAEEADLKECNKLLSLLSYYFAVNALIRGKENNYFGFMYNNKELLNKWMNATTFQEYKDYAEEILAELESFKKTNVYRN